MPLRPMPWTRRWQRYTDRFKGYTYQDSDLLDGYARRLPNDNRYLNQGWQREVVKYDLLLQYRSVESWELFLTGH